MFHASIQVANEEIVTGFAAGCCEEEGSPALSTNKVLANNVLKSTYVLTLYNHWCKGRGWHHSTWLGDGAGQRRLELLGDVASHWLKSQGCLGGVCGHHNLRRKCNSSGLGWSSSNQQCSMIRDLIWL